MITKKYIYDEGYGCGPREYTVTGISVNELIEKLQELSEMGYGNEIVYDDCMDPMTTIALHDYYENDEDPNMKIPIIE